ncbi:MAG: hypothetical protein L6437_15545 [Kiritimatiellae bacterium]|nr:hypothetical protein [Kiritimatiellia bacterium]
MNISHSGIRAQTKVFMPRFRRGPVTSMGCVIVIGLSLPFLSGCGTIKAQDPAGVAGQFQALDGGWQIADKGYGGPADGNWSYALGGRASWTDYRIDCRISLVRPADRQDGMELTSFAYYHALGNLGGYEAAVVFRYESPSRQYRVALSSLWKEIILWRPTGGVLQVQPYAFETNKTYDVSVAACGAHITVSVNGEEVINWWDTADPVLKGKVGLARKEGASYFSSVGVNCIPAQRDTPPAHRPQYREVKWHNLQWFFDGKEPVFVIKNNVLDHMKFIPGYRPAMYTFNYISDWNRFYPTKVTDFKVVEAGKRLVTDTVAIDPDTNKQSKITCATHLVVSFDAATGMYTYDQDCKVTIPPEESAKVSPAWDHGDAVFLGGVGSAQTRDPKAFRALYQWSVFQADDGKYYKIPMNHNGHYLSSSTANGGPLNPTGGIWVVVDDPILSPCIKIRGLATNVTNVSAGHCWWAYDMHTMFSPTRVDNKVPAGEYVTKVSYIGMKAADARALLSKASFYKPNDLSVRIPVYAAGVGFMETFDKEVLLASPHQEHRLWAGVIDKTVGHGDKFSLRLDGPTEAWTTTGGSYFMTGYGKTNRVTVWVKTLNVTGEGPVIGFRRWDNSYGEFYPSGLTGTRDWTLWSFITTGPIDCFGVTLYFRNGGSGTVWMDDFKVEPITGPLPEGVQLGKTYPVNPPASDVVLRWNGKGAEDAVLDESGYGHHGKFFGGVSWTTDNGRRVISLNGTNTYIWPLCSPALRLQPPYTFVLDIKPESGGPLMFWGWNFYWHLTGSAPKLGIGYQLHAGTYTITSSQPFLTTGQWHKVVLVVATNQFRVFCDGKFIETVKADSKAGDWGLYCTSTWHRHMSFFGAGPGNMTLTKDNPTAGIKGSVGAFTVYNRGLTDQEIAAMGGY